MEEEFTNERQSKLHVAMTIRNTHILLKDDQGHLVLNKSIDQYLYHPDRSVSLMDTKSHSRSKHLKEGKLLRRWNRADEVIAFLHIGAYIFYFLFTSLSLSLFNFFFPFSAFYLSCFSSCLEICLAFIYSFFFLQSCVQFHYSNFSSTFLSGYLQIILTVSCDF